MFVDASAAISILSGEADSADLMRRLDEADRILMSPIAIYETVTGLARKRTCTIAEAEVIVDLFLIETAAEVVEISSPIGRMALEAFARFGKGRHKADLNMGDCFAYACARSCDMPLLYKGNDFVHTDIVGAQGQ